MEINNLEQIKDLLIFETEDDFYHLQILKRKKENPTIKSNAYVVKTYYIRSVEQLDFYMPEIICLCNFHNARGCINLNKRSFEKATFNTLKKITDQIMNKDYKSTRNAYNSVVGAVGNPKKGTKKWLIDIDVTSMAAVEEVKSLIPEEVFVDVLKTKNGYHLITLPFNIMEFKVPKEHEIHKNNPTILFIPNIK